MQAGGCRRGSFLDYVATMSALQASGRRSLRRSREVARKDAGLAEARWEGEGGAS